MPTDLHSLFVSSLFQYTIMHLLTLFALLSLLQGVLLLSPLKSRARIPRVDTRSKFRRARYILPTTLSPESYDISIVPIIPINEAAPPGFTEWRAPAVVKIVVWCNAPTNQIVLTASNLTVNGSSVKVTRIDTNAAIPIMNTALDTRLQFYNISLGQDLVVGARYQIEMSYRAYISSGNTGLYRGYYLDDEGNRRWYALTLFAPVWFRRMVPGFDEPRYKATFTMHIGRSPVYNSASNTPINGKPGQQDTTGMLPVDWVWDHYQSTVTMSSYLLAFIVSDFGYEASDQNGYPTPVQVIAPPHLLAKGGGSFAVGESIAQLKFFEDLLEISYSMPKMDNVAVPRQFSQFGAMENWGLIAYSDYRLLYFPNESMESDKYSISKIISHETAHQWFGNLVTCRWWSDVFLNEGFATYMSYSGVQSIHPEYDPLRKFLYESVQSALVLDAGPTSHAVVNDPSREQIESMAIYDRIPYDKGASLLRMMENVLGADLFMQGVISYVHANQYGVAVQDDLYAHLQSTAGHMLPPGKTVESIMRTWTAQLGFPLVRVSKVNESRIYISQERFSNNRRENSGAYRRANYAWEVPVGIATQREPDNVKPTIWLERNAALKSYDIDTTQWLIVNPGGYGFYRVLYDTPLFHLILDQLEKDPWAIDSLSKSQLISDYFTFAEQALVQYETALSLTKYLAREPDHVVWITALTALTNVIQAAKSTEGGMEEFKEYFTSRVEGALDLIGWRQAVGERGINVTLRSQLLELASTLESSKLQQLSLQYFEEWTYNRATNPIPSDIQKAVYCSAIAANPLLIHFAMERYTEARGKTGEYAEIQATRLATAMTCSKEVTELEKLLYTLLDADPIISPDHMRTVITGVGTNLLGRDLANEFIRSQWKSLLRVAQSPEDFAGMLSDLSAVKNAPADIADHQALAQEIKGDPAYAQIASSLRKTGETIKKNIQWTSAHLKAVMRWLVMNA